MKISAGNALALLIGLWLCLGTVDAQARLSATVDRADVAIGETLRLVLTGDAGERPDEIDLSTLERDFEVLKRSSATNARLVNGSQSVTRTLELELAPRRVGLVTIPSFTVGGRASTPIAVKVSPAPDIDAGDALVLFDAELDRESVYVQAQLLLTLTLQQAINLDQREVTPLELPNADVEMLEQRTFQRQLNGRLWQVIELRYAIFPQTSGTLQIPELTFSGREILPGRSLLGARLGRRLVISTDPLNVDVRPVPEDFPGDVWLPARDLRITENWSKPPESLSLGDSSTRTLEIVAEGLQGSQIPPLESLGPLESLAGLRFYPGQETIDQSEVGSGLAGLRTQSEALVPSQPGQWTLPERVLPWWNTDTDQLEYARIPARDLQVTAASTLPATGGLSSAPASPANIIDVAPLWLYGVTASGWLTSLILGLLWWRHSRSGRPTATSDAVPDNERRALVALRLACQQQSPKDARVALLHWAQLRFNDPRMDLNDLRAVASPALTEQIDTLNRCLYASGSCEWQGNDLFTATREHPNHQSPTNTASMDSLYPASS